jgi:hypothetical protein
MTAGLPKRTDFHDFSRNLRSCLSSGLILFFTGCKGGCGCEMMIQLVKGNRTITAQIVHLEGELLTVALLPQDIKQFTVGDVITCKHQDAVYHSRVLRIWNNQLYLFFSIYKESFQQDGRRVPRVKVDLNGFAMNQGKHTRKVFHVRKIKIIDISILGVGFLVEKQLESAGMYTILPQADLLPIKADIAIRNCLETENGFRYGAEFKHITPNHFQTLRTYVLTQQLSANAIPPSPQ